jgi:hypothetical protein
MVKTGPNDASGIVWALGKRLFTLLTCYIVYLDCNIGNTGYKGKGGLNDASGVVWALGECF